MRTAAFRIKEHTDFDKTEQKDDRGSYLAAGCFKCKLAAQSSWRKHCTPRTRSLSIKPSLAQLEAFSSSVVGSFHDA